MRRYQRSECALDVMHADLQHQPSLPFFVRSLWQGDWERTWQYEPYNDTLDPGSIPGISTIRLVSCGWLAHGKPFKPIFLIWLYFDEAVESKSPSCTLEQMTWYVYIAKARTGRYYTGITTDPIERMTEHNAGTGSRFAVHQGPFQLVWTSASFPDKSQARLREVQIKKWTRYKKEQLIKGEWR
jgi:putative endonuclease